jgi:hypothetical protein
LQWLQDPSEINGDNLNNVRHAVGRHFRNRKRKYLKDKINDLATNSKNKNQHRSNLAKDENGDLLANFHNLLNRWKSYFSRFLNIHNFCDVKQIEKHTAGPLVPGLSYLEAEIPIAKLKKYKSPGSNQSSRTDSSRR